MFRSHGHQRGSPVNTFKHAAAYIAHAVTKIEGAGLGLKHAKAIVAGAVTS